MNSTRALSILAVLCIAACATPGGGDSPPPTEHVGTATQRVTSTLLHPFLGGAADGDAPEGDPLLSGSTLYGTTLAGGASARGTVFKVNTDGTGFALVRSFAGGAGDGEYPRGSLAMSGVTLYGMTRTGGASGLGTVFKVNTDGTNFALLHSFAGGAGDGKYALGSLVVSGSTLYGMTPEGGAPGLGTVFKVDTDGTNYALLHSFAGGTGDGQSPHGSLVASGSTLYGLTYQGGASGYGTVFKVDTDGTGYALLHSLGASDGQYPEGSLVASGSTLYGMTSQSSGVGMPGVVFKVNTDGTGYALVRSFSGGSDADYPLGSLVASGSTLYGMTAFGGTSGLGCMFKVNTDGTGYAVFRSFTGGAGDGGGNPRGALVASGSILYGMTEGGPLGKGVVFKVDLALPCAINEHVSANVCVACAAGNARAAGDDPAGANTSCTVMICAVDHHVAVNACVACAPGSTRPAGDLATGPNTACTSCAIDHHVASNACVACAPGSTRPAGDLTTGPNTACTATTCAINQHVASNACAPCAPGSTRPAGDLATGADTACAAKACTVNEYVSSHACVPCAPGSSRPAGDLAAGADTTCSASPADGDAASPDSGGGGGGGGGDGGDAASDTSSSDSGCSCTTASSRSRRASSGAIAAFAALALAVLRRRREVR